MSFNSFMSMELHLRCWQPEVWHLESIKWFHAMFCSTLTASVPRYVDLRTGKWVGKYMILIEKQVQRFFSDILWFRISHNKNVSLGSARWLSDKSTCPQGWWPNHLIPGSLHDGLRTPATWTLHGMYLHVCVHTQIKVEVDGQIIYKEH